MSKLSKIKSELALRHLYDNSSGKAKESAIVSGFLELLQLNPDSVEESECPDFHLSFGGAKLFVGLEVTEVNADTKPKKGSQERKTYSEWKKLAIGLRAYLCEESEPLPRVYGSVFFNCSTSTALKNLDRAEFFKEIVFVLRGAALSEAGSQIAAFDKNRTPIVATLVSHLYVRVFPSDDNFLWWSADLQSGTIASTEDSIKTIAESKKEKAKKYDWRSSSERWLLIYAAGNGLTDIFVNPAALNILDIEPFTRIFIWDKFSDTIYSASHNVSIVLEKGAVLYLSDIPELVRPYLRQT
jgi:hypothetical protein